MVAVALAFIGAMTLRPSVTSRTLPFSCIICGSLGGVDFVLNIALFVPLGLGLYWLVGCWKKSQALGATTTLAVELLQWRFIPGRDASFGDLLANGTGTALGIAVAVWGASWLIATGRRARTLAAFFATLSMLVVVTTSWLLQPERARYPLSVQWKPSRPNMDDFTGELKSASLNGVPVRATEVLRPTRLLDAETRSLSVRANFSPPTGPTVRQSIIFRLASHWEEGVFLGQWQGSIIARSHVVAERFRFRPPLVGLAGLLTHSEPRPDTAVNVEFVSNPRAITLRLMDPDESAMVTVRRTAGLGWLLLLPWDVAVTQRWVIANAAWMAAMVLPVGFFAIRARRHSVGSIAWVWWPLAVSVGTMLVAPALFGLSVLGVADWAGVVVGITVGAILERLTATDLRPPLNPRPDAGTLLT
jgi:hypothetical protein